LGFHADLPTVHISCAWERPVPLWRDASKPRGKTLKMTQFRTCVNSALNDNE